ncbi:MAG TPA: IS4 family transposase [Acidimicrobiales bacterium]
MAQSTAPRLRLQIFRLRRLAVTGPDLALETILPQALIRQVLAEEGASWRRVFYTPWLTFWAFFWQALNPDHSCRAAVKRIAAGMARRGEKLDDEDTGPYCKARARLPEAVPSRLMRSLGHRLHDEAPEGWLWCGRRVKVVDGTTVSLPDTAANPQEYPRSRSQEPGLGFPIARMVVLFCLATGAVLEAAVGKYQGKQTGENAWYRRLWEEGLSAGDVSLGDRYYGSYFDIAPLSRRGVDGVYRLHQLRVADFRRGRRLGKEDHVVTWSKPARPDWMERATYDDLPGTMEVRVVRVHVDRRGFRTRVLDLVTTLLDAEVYTRNDLASLYRRRWDAELNLRSIKVVLDLDVLRCKAPESVRKEIWMGLLGYNVIRAVMAEAAGAHGRMPHRLSFKGALQTVLAHAEALREEAGQRRRLWKILLESVANDEVGHRPDRVEPRARKRRPKPYPLLMVPRKEAKEALLNAS